MARISLDKNGYVVHSDAHSNGSAERAVGSHSWGSGNAMATGNNSKGSDKSHNSGSKSSASSGGSRSLGHSRHNG